MIRTFAWDNKEFADHEQMAVGLEYYTETGIAQWVRRNGERYQALVGLDLIEEWLRDDELFYETTPDVKMKPREEQPPQSFVTVVEQFDIDINGVGIRIDREEALTLFNELRVALGV